MKKTIFGTLAVMGFALIGNPITAADLNKMSRKELISEIGEADRKFRLCLEENAVSAASLNEPVKDSAWLLVNVFCRSEMVQMGGIRKMIDLKTVPEMRLGDSIDFEWINLVNAAELIADIRLNKLN